MRLLLDTSILIALSRVEMDRLDADMAAVVQSSENQSVASVASLWEIAIKTRLGKLDPLRPLWELPELLKAERVQLLVIDHSHVLAELDPQPNTRDPFDRLLLAQCQIEGMRLVTLDRALSEHPLAWRAP